MLLITVEKARNLFIDGLNQVLNATTVSTCSKNWGT